MTSVARQMHFPIRSKHKETDWKESCDDLFHKYLEIDDFGHDVLDSSYPDEHNAFQDFDFFPETNENFVIDSIESPSPEAQSDNIEDYWAQTFRDLEDKAAQVGARNPRNNQSSYTSGSDAHSAACNPKFLSLGGHPPPHLEDIGVFSLEPPRGRSRQAANPGTLRRSKTPSGIRKTVRHSKSQPNMMNASRYRVGLGGSRQSEDDYLPPVPQLLHQHRYKPLSPPPSTEYEQLYSPTALSPPIGLPNITRDYDQFSPGSEHLSDEFFGENAPSPVLLTGPQDVSAWLNGTWAHPHDYLINPQTAPQSARTSWYRNTYDPRIESPPISPSFNPWSAAHYPTSPAQMARRSYPVPTPSYIPAHEQTLNSSFDGITLTDQSDLLLTKPHQQPPVQLPYYHSATAPPTPHRTHTRAKSNIQIRSPSPSVSPAPRSRSRRSPPPSIQTTNDASSRHRRSESTTATATSGRAPRSASSGGFVNFTPSDSRKLLTGVAPSGSSKTKARREKEQAEKRRKLSEAAVRAVIEAGGDLDCLERAGLV